MKRWRWRRRIRVANGRLYVCGRRCHHGLSGLALTLVGIAMVWHDLKDFPWRPTAEWVDR